MSDTKFVDMLLRADEWAKFEVKRAAVQPRRLLETVCAFANKEGGLLVVGVEDPKKRNNQSRLVGISEAKDNISEFWRDPVGEFIITRHENKVNLAW